MFGPLGSERVNELKFLKHGCQWSRDAGEQHYVQWTAKEAASARKNERNINKLYFTIRVKKCFASGCGWY